MRLARTIFASCALIACSACGAEGEDSASRVESLEEENAELREQLAALEEKLSRTRDAAEEVRARALAVESAGDGLRSQVGRFDGENWRDVVPDVESSTGEVEDAQSGLDGSLSELDDAMED